MSLVPGFCPLLTSLGLIRFEPDRPKSAGSDQTRARLRSTPNRTERTAYSVHGPRYARRAGTHVEVETEFEQSLNRVRDTRAWKEVDVGSRILFCSDKAEARRDDDARHARTVDGYGCRVAAGRNAVQCNPM